MTSTESKKGNLWSEADAQRGEERPPWRFSGFHHIEFYVANAKMSADWYCLRMGFDKIGYKGLETGVRTHASHVLRSGQVTLVFTSPLNPGFSPNDGGGHIAMDVAVKGDAVKDIGLCVDDVNKVYEHAVANGAKAIRKPQVYKDEHGSVLMATIETYGHCTHTLIQKTIDGVTYNGKFLPGYKMEEYRDPIQPLLPPTGIEQIDHVVGNQPDYMMRNACDWYYRCLKFHRFWSVDDKQIHTSYSSLRSEVVSDFDHTVRMPINEPALGKRKSQIQEYVDYHGGAGVQHVALHCADVIKTITALRARGVEFLKIPPTYYKLLRERLGKASITVKEDLNVIEKLGLLCDFDEEGYLLQLFTKPLEDRPTLFFEFIQRAGNQGFGVGNFKALFESIEAAQNNRGNL